MSHHLIQLAPGAYDLLLHRDVIGSVVGNDSYQPYTWTAELLEELPRSKRPYPFREIEHHFSSLEDLRVWLDHLTVQTNNRYTAGRD